MTWLEDMYLGSPALAEVEAGSAFDFSPGNNHTACSAPCLPLNYSLPLLSGPVYPECSEAKKGHPWGPFPQLQPQPSFHLRLLQWFGTAERCCAAQAPFCSSGCFWPCYSFTFGCESGVSSCVGPAPSQACVHTRFQ